VILDVGKLDWDLSGGRLEFSLVRGGALKLIPIVGTATATTSGRGVFRVALYPRVNPIFERLVSRLGAAAAQHIRVPEITGDITLRTQNATGLSLDSMALAVQSVPIGLLELRSIALGFDPATNRWLGTLQLRLPGPEPRTLVDASMAIRDGGFERATVDVANRSMAGGVALRRLHLDARVDPFAFGGDIALGAGPRVNFPGFPDGPMIGIEGALSATAGTPSRFEARGRTLIGALTGNSRITMLSTGRTDFAGDLGLAVRPDIGVSANVNGFVQRQAFLVQGGARVRLLGLDLNGEGLISHVGVAACVPIFGGSLRKSASTFRAGFGLRFRDERLDLMAGNCDVAPWSAVALGDKAGTARAAQAAPIATVDLPAGLPATVFEVTGTVAPPRVTVTGPGGVRATTPADPAATRDGAVVFLRDAQERRTFVAVPAPRAGRWELSLEPGSSPVASVRRAAGLPAPKAKARVTGRGHRRTLRWTLAPRRGQVVTFVEEGAQTAERLARTSARRGSVRFRPGDGRAGRRSIVAIVEQDGVVRERLVAGRYSAPAPQKPGRPKRVTLRRRGGALSVKWARAAAARSYEVRVAVADGRRLLIATARRSLRVPGVSPREAATVTVTGVRGSYSGRSRSARLRAARRR
jgi:hypothetical protein